MSIIYVVMHHTQSASVPRWAFTAPIDVEAINQRLAADGFDLDDFFTVEEVHLNPTRDEILNEEPGAILPFLPFLTFKEDQR